jgi:hypothetical protein
MDMGEKREGWAGVITRWGRSRAVSPVGWVERSDTSSMPERVAMGIASLHPSYDITSRSRGALRPRFAW